MPRTSVTVTQLLSITQKPDCPEDVAEFTNTLLGKIARDEVRPAFRCALPKKQQRKLGLLPPVERAS